MNTELKKLVELEMDIYLDGEYSERVRLYKSLEAFAESVVKLCAEHTLNSSDRHRREYFAASLLEHFGVDEWITKNL